MKKPVFYYGLFLLIALFLLSSCDKGYQVRFANYSTEVMDSMVIGHKKLVFTEVERLTETAYSKLKSGTYDIQCISKTKKRYGSSIKIDKTGSGKRTVQVDGTGAISILED